ncbi:MAG: fucose isomerase [Thermoguttaceae bacterium]|nr:fucose isomerase [Thermoguttaceae bacterium]
MAKLGAKKVYLAASGDLRLPTNQTCWAEQAKMEEALKKAVSKMGYQIVRAHPYKPDEKHGFISSQKEGIEIFSRLDPDAPIIIAESVWEYSHHIYPGLLTHRGPVLNIANWSGTWPGLVGMLNINACLTKAGRKFSTLWSVDFTDDWFLTRLKKWLETGKEIKQDTSHVHAFDPASLKKNELAIGEKLAADMVREKVIMGIFDEGCMGMYNALVPDELLFPLGIYKERLNQSALYYETMNTSNAEAEKVYKWLLDKGVRFHLGKDEKTELTKNQVLLQCKMYLAAARIADRFGAELFGIQYQQGLKDILPASDLVEGILNNADRPPVKAADGRIIKEGKPYLHFNEVDECAALDALLDNRVLSKLGYPPETTLHDVRWGDEDKSGTTDKFVWVFQISGAAPPAHFKGGWKGAQSWRQAPMYFPFGGGTLGGVCKEGEILWSRTYIEKGKLGIDIGRGRALDLPEAEVRRRLDECAPTWPIMNAVLYGISRNQFMGRHHANHIQVCYPGTAAQADRALAVKAAMAHALGFKVSILGNSKE